MPLTSWHLLLLGRRPAQPLWGWPGFGRLLLSGGLAVGLGLGVHHTVVIAMAPIAVALLYADTRAQLFAPTRILAAVLQTVLAPPGGQPGQGMVSVTPVDSSNSLVLRGDPSAMAAYRLAVDGHALVAGSLFVALGMTMFAHAGLLTGGVAGVAFLVSYATGWSLALCFFVFSLPFFWLSWRRLGPAFTLKSLVAVTLVTAMVVFRAQRLTQFSATDGLTGLPNRNWLNTRVPHQVTRARAEGRTLCLALVDLDHFRQINAELGHLAGDCALVHATRVIQRGLAEGEPMIRAGGEEFVILMSLPVGAAWERMESLRRRLEGHPFTPADGAEPRKLTFSAGLACCPQDANDLSGLMKRADERLRAAKAAGRNRVVARDGE